MESPAPNTEVRLAVAQCFRTLTTSTDNKDIIAALQTLHSYLDEGPDSRTTLPQRAEFRRAHFTRSLQFLVSNIQADWLHGLTAAQRTELWDGLFLKGPPEQALLVLMEGIGEPSTNLDHLVSITERFLQTGRLAELLWSYCQGAGPSDSPQLRETLLGRIVALPDLTANRLHPNNKPLFLPQQYYPLLATEMLTALERTCQALKDGTDCSLTFVAQTLGKVCIQGHSGQVLAVMAPRLSVCTCSDMVWQRVCWKLLENVPQRWLESVLTGLVQAVSGPDALGRIIGNLVLKNRKAQYVITHKLLLLQYKYETQVLRIILGYLSTDRERRPLLIQVLRTVSQAWANPSAVKHTPIEQQLYVSKALLLSVSLLKDSELQELRSDLLQCMLGGMQSHLDSSVVRIRHMGMVVGECLSSRMDISGTKLKFEYDQDEETQELLSLMTPSTGDEAEAEPVIGYVFFTSLQLQQDLGGFDDELTPYDMSGDQEISKASPPRYLRDCLETLISSEDSVRVELSLRVAEGLVRKNVFAAREVRLQEKFCSHVQQNIFKTIVSYLSARPQVTFDLLGSDQLVLGRLIHTLGLLMHLAVNAPVAAQMGRALLDFVWAVRYHADQMVRRGVLFAVCSVFLSINSQNLLVELSDQLFETRTWLADVAEGDPDADCRNLAVQSLVLLDKSLKKQLQDQQALGLES
uniref:TEL2, telomere maintenance 2, homolog (S. cerevisiae) n=1 Tax=Sparus aurata TaxID=8175 RepID=A0A671WUI5_SPAAU